MATSKPPPCWETSGDVFPKPCGNMTDSEKEIQLRGGTRSEGARTPRLRRTKQCGEKNVDVLYLRAASQPKLAEQSFAQLKSTVKIAKSIIVENPKINDEYVLLQNNNNNLTMQNVRLTPKPINKSPQKLLRQTLLAITENFSSPTISVKKGDVVTLLACRNVCDQRLTQPLQWFYVRARDRTEGYIPAEVAGHGFL